MRALVRPSQPLRPRNTSAWEKLGVAPRAILVFANLCMCTCCYVMQFYATSCFSAFELRGGEIDKALGGDWTKFCSTLGTPK